MYKSFRGMPVWVEAMALAEEIFRISEKFPRKEDYGLTSQLRRAVVSISGNIAEAFGRCHAKDKVNFYYFSRGSITETQSHLEYAQRVGYLTAEFVISTNKRLDLLIHEINKIIVTLRNQSRSQSQPQSQS